MASREPETLVTPRRSARVSARVESVQQSASVVPDPNLKPTASTMRGGHRKAKRKRRRQEPPAVAPRGDILFPVEVWKQVFEHLYDEVGQRHFARMVRFLSALRREAESVLYKRPLLVGTMSAVRFAESISLSDHRARPVESLTIKVTARDKKHGDLYLDTLRAIIDALPRLSSIEIHQVARRGSAVQASTSASWDLSTVLQGKAPPLRYIRGYPVVLDDRYAATLQVLSPRLEEVRLLSPVHIPNGPVPGTLSGTEWPKLHTLACDIAILRQLDDIYMRNITHLWLVDRLDSQAVNTAIDLVGPQLVSLRIEQTLRQPSGPMYPTERPVRWDRCIRLKFLHVDDIVDYRTYVWWSPELWYGISFDQGWLSFDQGWLSTLQLSLRDQPQRLPPVLETLVWAPAWVRKVLDDRTGLLLCEPNHTHRQVLRRFAEDMLERFAHLKEVLYMWTDEGFLQCVLSEEGDLLEARTESEHVYYDAWAHV